MKISRLDMYVPVPFFSLFLFCTLVVKCNVLLPDGCSVYVCVCGIMTFCVFTVSVPHGSYSNMKLYLAPPHIFFAMCSLSSMGILIHFGVLK